MSDRAPALPNRTRSSASIPRRLLREGKVHLLPVYALMRTSDLGREGIDHSGSFRFADHIYRGRPSGRFGVGALLDRVLLRLPGARSMRNRYLHTRAVVAEECRRRAPRGGCRVLSVPCGIARELVEAGRILAAEGVLPRPTLIGMDLDPEPLELSRRLAGADVPLELRRGDALSPDDWPVDLDVVVSTGLGEFLDDDALLRLYRNCHRSLRPGGVFAGSGMQRDRVADYLARELAELHTHYRTPEELRRLLAAGGFRDVAMRQDAVGLQTLFVARKEAEA